MSCTMLIDERDSSPLPRKKGHESPITWTEQSWRLRLSRSKALPGAHNERATISYSLKLLKGIAAYTSGQRAFRTDPQPLQPASKSAKPLSLKITPGRSVPARVGCASGVKNVDIVSDIIKIAPVRKAIPTGPDGRPRSPRGFRKFRLRFCMALVNASESARKADCPFLERGSYLESSLPVHGLPRGFYGHSRSSTRLACRFGGLE